MASILLQDVSFSYSSSSRSILSGLSFTVEAGTFLCIAGANGSGKSTLSLLLNGLLVPSSGKVLIDGLDTGDKKNRYEIRRRVGLLFQNPDNQIVGDTVEDDIAFGPENLALEEEEITKRVEMALSATGLSDKRYLSPSSLSGGEKAKLGIAGLLALDPEVLVLDEATAMLDPKARKDVLETLEELKTKYNKTIILITHNGDETLAADRIIVLEDGKVAFDGNRSQVYSNAGALKKMGVVLPPFVELSLLLREKGIDITTDTFDGKTLIEKAGGHHAQ